MFMIKMNKTGVKGNSTGKKKKGKKLSKKELEKQRLLAEQGSLFFFKNKIKTINLKIKIQYSC